MGAGAGMTGPERVVLSPPVRRAVADLHAQRVFAEHVAAFFPRATYEQIARVLTARRVPPVRGRGPWDSMRVRNLLRRVQRSATYCAKHEM